MDVLNDRKYNVFFGGGYNEQWSADYKMSVVYHDRKVVEAAHDGEKWIAVGGDAELTALLSSPDCPKLTQQYFQAAATAYAAAQDCLRRGLPLDKMYDSFYFDDNNLVAPELMRLLMDDCGLPMNMAYLVCANCCADVNGTGIDFTELLKLQPRTSHVMSIMRRTASEIMIAVHDARFKEYREPFGAVCCGENVTLRLRVIRGKAQKIFLIMRSDAETKEYLMERDGEWFSYTMPAPEQPAAMWYSFRIETSDSSHWLCPDNTGYFGRLYGREETGFRLTVYDKSFDTPAWFRKSVMYQVFPDRFAFSNDGTAERGIEYHKSLCQTPELHASLDEPVRWQARDFEKAYSPDDFYGGTFKGIEGKLPYLKGLGISCLYLNPIVEARSNHRYDTSDYHRPDPILGSMEDFEHLCIAAEECGIKIILDGVFSHTGADSRYFDLYGHYGRNGACSGTGSEYYDWYSFKHFPDDYKCWWGFKDLPEVNELNPKWQSDIVTGDDSIVKKWLRHGASGWRLDVADELPDSVLELIRTATKSVNPDAPIVGEVWEDAIIKESYGGRRTYALGRALDSVMNYPFRRAVLDFALNKIDAYALRDFLIGQQQNYPKPMYYSLMNLLGTHDVERLRSALASDVDIRSLSREEQVKLEFPQERLDKAVKLEKLCAAIQFMIPGVPSIYYGDEQGMCGVCDPFNRMPFKEGVQELHDWYASLSKLRNENAALSTGEVRYLAINKDMLAILRYVNDGTDAFGDKAENAVFAAIINRGAAAEYTLACKDAGIGKYHASVGECSAEIVKISLI